MIVHYAACEVVHLAIVRNLVNRQFASGVSAVHHSSKGRLEVVKCHIEKKECN